MRWSVSKLRFALLEVSGHFSLYLFLERDFYQKTHFGLRPWFIEEAFSSNTICLRSEE